MVIVTVELWPYGQEIGKQIIGTLKIVNMGGSAEKADYSYDLRFLAAENHSVLISGIYKGHVRKDGCWMLIKKILDVKQAEIEKYAKVAG
jgi:hypothetical protein